MRHLPRRTAFRVEKYQERKKREIESVEEERNRQAKRQTETKRDTERGFADRKALSVETSKLLASYLDL